MTATLPDPLTRQQLINLLSQHKQEWQQLYGIQDIACHHLAAMSEAASR